MVFKYFYKILKIYKKFPWNFKNVLIFKIFQKSKNILKFIKDLLKIY